MSYLDQEGLTRKQWYGIGFVVGLHVLLGWGFYTGLAIDAVKMITGPLETVNIENQAPPPEEAPPPPPKLEDIPPVVVAPDVVIETAAPPPPAITQAPPRPPPPPPPPVVKAAPPPAPPAPDKEATPRSNSVGISSDDYPEASRRAGEEGRTVVRVTIGTDGRVKQCAIIESSGFERLDTQACRVAERRWRFNAAERGGEKVESTKVQPIQWRLESLR